MRFHDVVDAVGGLGLCVAPAAPNRKVSFLKRWPERASFDDEQLNHWCQTYPDHNGIVACGKRSNVCVIDIDRKGEVDGLEEMLKLKADGYELPARPMVRTPSGGLHLYFKHRDSLSNSAGVTRSGRGIADSVDFRTERGCVTAPGSVVNGKAYEWIERPASADDIPDLPQWVVDRLIPKRLPSQFLPSKSDGDFSRLIAHVASLYEGCGKRNNTLYWASCVMRDDGADDVDINDLCIAAQQSGLDYYEVRSTIERAFGSAKSLAVLRR